MGALVATKPTWKNILVSAHLKRPMDIESFFWSIVHNSGYPYFLWNGRVYEVVKNAAGTTFTDSGLTEDDIQ